MNRFFLYFVALSIPFIHLNAQEDPLPSWNEGPTKKAIIEFVRTTTDSSNPKFVPTENRIATFDQDGTLWVEQPLYTQAIFALDRLKTLAKDEAKWKTEEPYKAILNGDKAAIEKFDEQDWARIIAVTHTGMSTSGFLEIVKQWLATAKHPRFNHLYTELIYQPMKEVMDYLRSNDYKVYIVTGGGQEFVRAYGAKVYGVQPENVIGSSVVTSYEYKDGKPVLMRLPKEFFVDNYGGKPIGINLMIGKRPYAAFGNSTGDQQMLEWTSAGDGSRLSMLVYHDDPDREYAYGPAGGLPGTIVGTFSEELMREAKEKGWFVISMKKDWKRIFPFEK